MNRTRRTIGIRVIGTVLVAASSACSTHGPKDADARTRTGTSSDATINGGAGQTQAFSSMRELIQSRAPGVQIVQAGESYALRIRGVTSPSGNNDPLIVIDGTVSALPGTRSLDAINPNDVLKLEVLKDAASTAFYGMRGSNGVILITTRKR